MTCLSTCDRVTQKLTNIDSFFFLVIRRLLKKTVLSIAIFIFFQVDVQKSFTMENSNLPLKMRFVIVNDLFVFLFFHDLDIRIPN